MNNFESTHLNDTTDAFQANLRVQTTAIVFTCSLVHNYITHEQHNQNITKHINLGCDFYGNYYHYSCQNISY